MTTTTTCCADLEDQTTTVKRWLHEESGHLQMFFPELNKLSDFDMQQNDGWNMFVWLRVASQNQPNCFELWGQLFVPYETFFFKIDYLLSSRGGGYLVETWTYPTGASKLVDVCDNKLSHLQQHVWLLPPAPRASQPSTPPPPPSPPPPNPSRMGGSRLPPRPVPP